MALEKEIYILTLEFAAPSLVSDSVLSTYLSRANSSSPPSSQPLPFSHLLSAPLLFPHLPSDYYDSLASDSQQTHVLPSQSKADLTLLFFLAYFDSNQFHSTNYLTRLAPCNNSLADYHYFYCSNCEY